MDELNWNTSLVEDQLIKKILDRYVKLVSPHKVDMLNRVMDITATHLNGCPLDLEKLLCFSEFDFLYDLAGIFKSIDRTTGKLSNNFLPRSSK